MGKSNHLRPIYSTLDSNNTLNHSVCPGLDHIVIRLGPAPPAPPSLPGLLAHTYVGTHPRWEPMCQYPVKIIYAQVDITFISPKLINGVPSHVTGALWLK